ncbi:hypothetical protein [Paludibacter sp.]|uniref:hypothetical protein n=1 Tax=Paludibacter sp. TaxID=1898105 RepID=UPI0013537F2A|nr:hypothetical protein [Paludibacter sp.]MTK53885.1 hypothetical protein [Paludibacter sp.]
MTPIYFKNLSKQKVLVLIFIIMGIKVVAQNPPVEFLSPEASNLGLVGNLPVSLHTGKVNIDIPLSMGIDNKAQNISLSYNTSGVIPDSHPGWVGLNWTLNVGGVITRVLKFIPDELENVGSYYSSGYTNSNSLTNLDNTPGTGSNCWNGLCTTADGAPDEFYFNVDGLNGKFFINASGKFQVQSNPNYKIEIEGSSPYDPNMSMVDRAFQPFKGFTLTSDNGTKYRFGYSPALIETSSSYLSGTSSETDGYATAWYLSQIIYPNHEVINYYYTDKFQDQVASGADLNLSQFVSGNISTTVTNGYSSQNAINICISNHAYLKSIESATYKVAFNISPTNQLKCGGCDLDHWQKLDSIVVTDKLTGTKNRSYGFTYTNDATKRLSLLSITQKDNMGHAIPPYEFTYDQNQLPPYNSAQTDYWGYFNGTSYSDGYASLIFPDNSNVFYYSPNREPNPTFISFGTLQQIKYPTGGTISLEYEPNDYSLSGIQTFGATNIQYDSIRWSWNASYWRNCGLYNGSQPLLLTSYADANIYMSPSGVRKSMLIAPGSYTVDQIATLTNVATGSNVAANINYRLLAPSPKAIGPGLRVKRIHYHNNSDEYIHEYIYARNYSLSNQSPNVSSGILGRKPIMVVLDAASYNIKTWTPGKCFSNPQNPLSLTLGNPIGYSEVADIIKDANGNILGYSINKYSNFDSNPDEAVAKVDGCTVFVDVALGPWSNKDYERGNLIKSTTYNSNGNIVKTIENYYSTTIFNLYSAVMPIQLIYNLSPYSGYKGAWNYCWYKNYFGTSYLVSKNETVFDPTGNKIISTLNTSHTYNQFLLPSSETTYSSTNKAISTHYSYPFELSSPISIGMTKKNMLNYPVETTQYYDNNLVKSKLMTHKQVVIAPDTLYLPEKEYSVETASPIGSFSSYNGSSMDSHYGTPNLEFVNYGLYGNICEIKDRAGVSTTYLWGYSNHYPIAKIEGLTYNEVATAISPTFINNLASDSNPSNYIELIRDMIKSSGKTAMISTYTYKPLVGEATYTNSQGVTSNYYYDTFNRLYLKKNDDKNILAKYRYGYQNNPDNGQGGYATLTGTLSGVGSSYTLGNSVSASISASGGSGNYSYSWSLLNGASVLSTGGNGSSFSFSCSQSGTLTLQCVITDNSTGQTATVTQNITCSTGTPAYGNFTLESGYTNYYNSLSSNGNTISFNLVFGVNSSTMNSGINYLVAWLPVGFRPSVIRYLPLDSGGRTWTITFSPDGMVYCQIVSGSSLSIGGVASFSGSFNL